MMTTLNDILQAIEASRSLFYRLVLVIGKQGCGKTKAMQAVSKMTSYPIININLELSKRLLEIPARRQPIEAQNLLSDLINKQQADVILLDNIELLFDPRLHLSPLRMLQILSRNTTIVSTWTGVQLGQDITYGSQDHPEYTREHARDIIIIDADPTSITAA